MGCNGHRPFVLVRCRIVPRRDVRGRDIGTFQAALLRAPNPRRSTRAPRDLGQSLVEFTLIIPFVLVILLAVADFGRYYAAGITTESAARAAAEAVAANYQKSPPGGVLGTPAPTPGSSTYYDGLHSLASSVVCGEMVSLPNAGGPTCSNIPVQVCVHDGADPSCSTEPAGRSIDPNCSQMASWPTNSQAGGSEASRYVEVRVCYRFSTIMNVSGIPSIAQILPVLNGDFFVQSDRMFTIVDY